MILRYIFFFLLAFNIIYFALHWNTYKTNLHQIISSQHASSSIEHKLSGYQKPAQHTCIHLGAFQNDTKTNAAIQILKDHQIPAFAIHASMFPRGNYAIRMLNADPNSKQIIALKKTLAKSKSLGYEFFDNKLLIGSFTSKERAIRYKNRLAKNFIAYSPQVISLENQDKVYYIQIQDDNAKQLESKKTKVQAAFLEHSIHFTPKYLKPSSSRCI